MGWAKHRSYLAPHEAFELGFGEGDRLVDRFAGLRALGNHLADRALCEHLRADPRRRRIAGKQGGHITARRIVVKRSLRRSLIFPGLEVAQLLERWNVDTMAPGDELFDRGARRQMGQQ